MSMSLPHLLFSFLPSVCPSSLPFFFPSSFLSISSPSLSLLSSSLLPFLNPLPFFLPYSVPPFLLFSLSSFHASLSFSPSPCFSLSFLDFLFNMFWFIHPQEEEMQLFVDGQDINVHAQQCSVS